MSALLAHAGHWLSSLIYVVPVLVLVALLVVDRVRHRDRTAEDPEPKPGAPPPA